MKKMKPVILLLLAFCLLVHSRPEDVFAVVPSMLRAEEMICINLKNFGTASTITTEVIDIETNNRISTDSIILNGYNCLSIQSEDRGSKISTSARLVIRFGDAVDPKRDIGLDNEKINHFNDLNEPAAFPIFFHQLKKRSIEVPANELITNIKHSKLHRRDLKDVEFSNRFSTFSDKSHDLEVPNQIAGTFQVFAMPPSTNKGQQTCPHCLKKPADDFLKLYCSSQLAVKIELIGRNVMYLLQNHSPGTNSTQLRRFVSYTIKQRCECEFTGNDLKKEILFMLVTPPRKFNLESIQALHLDENITLFPWQLVESYLLKMKNGPSCIDILTMQ